MLNLKRCPTLISDCIRTPRTYFAELRLIETGDFAQNSSVSAMAIFRQQYAMLASLALDWHGTVQPVP
jgi:hypothetical protein